MNQASIRTICQYKGVDIVQIANPRETLADLPDLKQKILVECDLVQRSVWNPQQSIEDNTINNDLLLLLSSNGKYTGFLSADRNKIGDREVVYLHDVMISQDHQGLGFCRLLVLLLVLDIFDCFSISRFDLVTATSNSRLISTLYTKNNIFKNLSFPKPNDYHKILLRMMRDGLFGDKTVNVDTGIINDIWRQPPDDRQHISRARNLTTLFGNTLALERGDALAIIASLNEEAIINANSYVRGALNVGTLNISL